MRIAVCNKSKSYMKKLKSILYKYAELIKLDAVVDCYFYGENLLNSGINYSMIFIGYSLFGENGLEISKKIRKTNSNCAIIFTCADTNFILEAIDVNPQAFLVSPTEEVKIFHVMNKYFEKVGSNYPILIKSEEDTVCLHTSEILYLEADNKHCNIHLETEYLNCNRTMAKVFEVLPKNHFLKINRSCIVNSIYVKKYNTQAVFLKNGEKLYIGRKYLNDFKQDYQSFIELRQP